MAQFYALMVKRLHYTKGKLIALIVQNLFPLVVICLALLIARSLLTVPDPPPLELSPQLFFAKADYNYLFAGGYYNNVTSPFVDSLFQPCGVAAAYSIDSPSRALECHLPTTDECTIDYPQLQYSCTCTPCEGFLNESAFHTPPPCYNKTVTGSRILNLTQAYDPLAPNEGYYSLHNYLLRSTAAFTEQRYGGVSLGHFKSDVAADIDAINADSDTSLPFLAAHSAAKVWYSLKGYHAMPAYLNTLNNAILRGTLGKADPLVYGEFWFVCIHSCHLLIL